MAHRPDTRRSLRLRRGVCALALLIAAGLTSGAAAQNEPLRLTRVLKVGTTYRVAATGTLTRGGSRERAGQRTPITPQRLTVTFAATATVAAVDSDGRATEIRYRVDRCAARLDAAQEQALVPPGGVLIARAESGRVVYEIADVGAADEARAQALGLVVRLPVSQTTFDDTFAPGRAVAPGESWSINTDAYRRELAEAGMNAERAEIVGRAKLNATRDVGGLTVNEVEAQVRATGLAGEADAAQGRDSTVTIDASFTVHAPRDRSAPVLKEVGRIDVGRTITGVDADGQRLTVFGRTVRTLNLTRSPIR